MTKILVIVESPGKIKKIGEYLGEQYLVKASYGICESQMTNDISCSTRVSVL